MRINLRGEEGFQTERKYDQRPQVKEELITQGPPDGQWVWNEVTAAQKLKHWEGIGQCLRSQAINFGLDPKKV